VKCPNCGDEMILTKRGLLWSDYFCPNHCGVTASGERVHTRVSVQSPLLLLWLRLRNWYRYRFGMWRDYPKIPSCRR